MINYKLVELNNKSRKGLYTYIKEPGKPGKYYKVKPDENIDYKIKKTKKRKYKKNIRKPIETQIKKTIKTVKTNDISNRGIHTLKKRLFANIIKDQQIKEILIQDHNLQKIKHRFDITITTKDYKNQTLFTAEKLNITPDQALYNAKEINVGENTKQSYQSIQKLKEKGWTIEQKEKGIIRKITMSITFRKA